VNVTTSFGAVGVAVPFTNEEFVAPLPKKIAPLFEITTYKSTLTGIEEPETEGVAVTVCPGEAVTDAVAD